jgi:hypothetical protein
VTVISSGIKHWKKMQLVTLLLIFAVPSGHVLVALMLLTMQCWRRLYETFYVSVFSEGRINLAQYLCGFIHYLAAASCIAAEAPIFAASSIQEGMM